MKKSHSLLYIFEFSILAIGFAVILILNLSFMMQVSILGSMLAIYCAIGLLHHKSHHDINGKVVLEYTLISALVLSLFIFLNISRI